MHNRHDQPTLKWKFDNIYNLKLDLINWNEQHAIALVNMVHGDVGCNGWLVYVVVESMAPSMILPTIWKMNNAWLVLKTKEKMRIQFALHEHQQEMIAPASPVHQTFHMEDPRMSIFKHRTSKHYGRNWPRWRSRENKTYNLLAIRLHCCRYAESGNELVPKTPGQRRIKDKEFKN